MDKYVKMKFQYYEVCCLGENGKEELYDLKRWIEKLSPQTYEAKKINVRGIQCRLEDFVRKKVADINFYAMRFMRMDELSNTYIIKEKAAAKHIGLNVDEYIGRSTAALYDPNHHILMVQMNRNGVGVASIQEYINITLGRKDDEENICYLRPILNPLATKGLVNRNIAKLDIRFSDVKKYKPAPNSPMEEVIHAFNKMDGVTAHVEVGLGRVRNESLNSETISGVVQEIYDNEKYVSSAKLTLSDDQKSNVFDLFENILHDNINFRLESRKEVGFEQMAKKMIDTYKANARQHIINRNRR